MYKYSKDFKYERYPRPTKKRKIDGVNTDCSYVEQFWSGPQSSNIDKLQERKVYS